MRIASINISDYGSTGRIMLQIAQRTREDGGEALTFSRNWFSNRGSQDHVYFGFGAEHFLHHALGFVTGDEGTMSVLSTADLISRLRRFAPDIIHLHNLHGWYLDLPMLFRYIKKEKIKTVWTFHDCWPFTGHCPYFDEAGCGKWRSACSGCPAYREYPESLFDNSAKMYRRKKRWFTEAGDITIVTPSEWLAGLVRQSFLGDYDVRVIHNGIDRSSFRNTPSAFREQYGIAPGEKMVLGVASDWDPRKGLDVFPKLQDRLGSGYRTVIVGLREGSSSDLPRDAVVIPHTSNVNELAEIYSAADVFVNPTREDNYPTVNLEAISCGTPVVTFDTGGSPESVLEGCGKVVPRDDVDALVAAVSEICCDGADRSEYLKRAADTFDSSVMAERYNELYRELLGK